VALNRIEVDCFHSGGQTQIQMRSATGVLQPDKRGSDAVTYLLPNTE
jgi:hypothetical protein